MSLSPRRLYSRKASRLTALFAVISLLGCGPDLSPWSLGVPSDGSTTSAPDGGTDGGPDGGPLTVVDRVDLLFVIDNSRSMLEEQRTLASAIPGLITALTTGDLDDDGVAETAPVGDLNAAVITADMGTHGLDVPSCESPVFGDDGVFRTAPQGVLACEGPFSSTLNARTPTEGIALTFELGCLMRLGASGCAFEQHLEAMLKATTPGRVTDWTVPEYEHPRPYFFRDEGGHGDGVNAGFSRPNSVLAIVLLTEEDDCSSANSALYDTGSTAFAGTHLSLRCALHQDQLHSIERYVEGLLQLRERPERIVFMPIVGVPEELAAQESFDWDRLLSDNPSIRDDRMDFEIDPSEPTKLKPSCEGPDGRASPPIRLLQTARRLEQSGAQVRVRSICEASYDSAMDDLARSIQRARGR